MIRVESVSCMTTGLREVSLQIHRGQLLAVAGPNGAGKSTLLRMLSGERGADEGVVLLDEVPINRIDIEVRARTIGVLPQSSSLEFAFRVDEVVALGRTAAGESGTRSIVRKAMLDAGVCHLASRFYPTLSGGEKQRVHLARVLAQLAEVERGWLLLDEPTASLDPAQQQAVLQIARSRARDGFGVVTVLHDLNLVARYADRVLLLCKGRVHAIGAPWEVLTPENLAACYGIQTVVLAHPSDGTPLVVAA